MKFTTRLTSLAAALAGAVLGASASLAGPIGLIDDFSGTLAPYTATRILKATPAASDNVGQWQITGGSLEFSTTTYNAIEQYALTRTDATLQVGEELRADYLGGNNGSQDIGLYVGAGHPTPDVRADYVNIYVRNNGQLFSRGFNGTTELSLAGGGSPAVDTLFIKRTAADAFELGYYEAGVRNVLSTRSALSNANIGNAIGFYADIRAAGVRGNMDNLRIVPEPATVVLAGVALMGLVAARRRRTA
ncbi:MAG: PEP-CTERM sorting domain-containing protein [Pirellulales bacterium]|nr:PEP-CTERM sorting domain-containing protein [Pirellulales bacterium]